MKSRAKMDPIVYIFSIGIILIAVVIVWFRERAFSMEGLLLIGVVAFLIIISTVNSYYKLEDDNLVIKIGSAKRRIPYSDIRSAFKGNAKALFKTSFTTKGIIITTHQNGTFLIGPVEVEEFLNELNGKIS